jgi:extracellular elastinolytic metalloproteinase
MAREIDRRDFSVNRTTAAKSSNLNARATRVSESLPGIHTLNIHAFDAATGNPSLIASEGAPAEQGNYVQRALSHVQSISSVLGLEETQSPEFLADPNVQISSSGGAMVHLQQQYKGVRIFQAAQGVRFTPDGAIGETVGQSVTVTQELEVLPKLTVQDAVLKAAQYVAEPQADEIEEVDGYGQSMPLYSVELNNFIPTIIAIFPNQPDAPAVLEPGPFADEIRANLIWFPLDNGLRLAWEVLLIMPDNQGQYRTMVDAESGEILYCRQLMSSVLAEGNVYVVDGSGDRQVVQFPKPLAEYGVPIPGGLPNVFPDHWVASNQASGNAINVALSPAGTTFQGAVDNGLVRFNPANPVGDDQRLLNIFYYNCFIHDFLYLYGFREADGNFQKDNFGRGGAFADPVTAFSHNAEILGTATMSTRVDGTSPVMNMGLVGNRHTAFDSSVVFHEFMHGVTNRLVGGPLNTQALEDFQSAGMGEGWGDYIACTINKTTVVAAWVVNKPGGIRQFPYDSNFPDHFGMLGTGRFNNSSLRKQHAVGEIWCATLMEMNRNIGAHLGVQLVMDGLKLSPIRPSFLDMRDSILKALDNKLAAAQLAAAEFETVRAGIWAAFAKFGMGPKASSLGASLQGVVADFEAPAALVEGIEQPATPQPIGQPPLPVDAGATPLFHLKPTTSEAFDDVLAAIRVHGEELIAVPNVVAVRPGYRFHNSQIASQPVISIVILRKRELPDIPARELIPARLGKVLVDVLPATPFEQIAFLKRQGELTQAGLQMPAGIIDLRLPHERSLTDVDVAAAGGLLDYVPPAEPLAEIEEEMTVVCHASPDAGFRNLREFIRGTKKSLTATMYEFNARHVLDTLTETLKAPRTFSLILDGGAASTVPGPPGSTVSKLAARDALHAALNKTASKQRFDFVWAAVGDTRDKTNGGFFPTAYHIKVAVRDGQSFWLSSGNWKESGQPKIDPINGPLPPGFDPSEFLNDRNREWHVIIHNPTLAKLFEAFIKHDIAQAKPLQKPGTGVATADEPMPDLFIAKPAAEAFAAFGPDFFPQVEKEFKKKVGIQPLMTPDNFPEFILPLILNAQKSIYFQNQSLKPSNSNSRYMPLFRALRDRSEESATNHNLDVKILVSEFTSLEVLKTAGFHMDGIKAQKECHNKGIIIDDEIVIVGSHNWTGQGATENRDASLIIKDKEIAAYFKEFFLFDWNRLPEGQHLLPAPLVALPNEPTPPGMIRVSWSDVFGDSRAGQID